MDDTETGKAPREKDCKCPFTRVRPGPWKQGWAGFCPKHGVSKEAADGK